MEIEAMNNKYNEEGDDKVVTMVEYTWSATLVVRDQPRSRWAVR